MGQRHELYLSPGDVAVVAVRERQSSIDQRNTRTSLSLRLRPLRNFVRAHSEEIQYLPGMKPDDDENITLGNARQLDQLIDSLKGIPRRRIQREIERVLERKTASDDAGDIAEVFTNYLTQISSTRKSQ